MKKKSNIQQLLMSNYEIRNDEDLKLWFMIKSIDKTAWENSQKIAEEVLNGLHHDLSEGATHYHSVFIDPHWADSLNETVVIGEHIFYK